MSKENRAKIKQRIEKVLVNKNKVLSDAYTKSLEELVEELKSYQIELEFQNEELERIQEELLNSRNAYQQLYQYAPVGYVLLDDDFRLIKFNKTFVDFFKLNHDLSGSYDFRKLIKPHEQNRFYNFARKLQKGGETESIEMAFQSQEKEFFYLAVNGNQENTAEGIQYRLTLLDVSDRKAIEEKLNRSEKHYRSLFYGSKDALLVLDFHSRKFVALNDQAVTLFGAESRNQMLQLGPAMLSPEIQENGLLSADLVVSMMEKAIKEGSNYFEWKHKRMNGDLFDASVLLTAFEMDGQTLMQTTVRDITESKLAEEKIKQSETKLKALNKSLTDANQTKDKLFSIISHDLRSPAAAVFGLASLLQENFDSLKTDEVKKIGMSIYLSAGNLSELLDNLLEWSRIQSGITTPDFKPGAVQEVVAYAVENLRQMAELKNILLMVHVEEQLMGHFDRHMIVSVVQNLLSNAIKFSPRGGKVVVMASKYNDIKIAIEVIDKGIGIPESMIDELFVVNNSKSRQGTDGERSSGLGLILCHEFVQMHKGSISVRSEEGKGSSFKVLLPIKPE